MRSKIKLKPLLIICLLSVASILSIVFGYRYISRYFALQNLEMEMNTHQIIIFEKDQGDLSVQLSNNAFLSDVYWESSDKNIVKINEQGHFEALKEGKAIITSSVKGASSVAKCEVTVNKIIELTDITIKGVPTKSIYPGDEFKLSVNLIPKDTTQNKIIFHSSNPTVATIDNNGLIKAIEVGKTIINISVENTSHKEDIEINVIKKPVPVKSIFFEEGSQLKMESGSTHQLNALVTPQNADNKDIVYSSSNQSILDVSKDGLLTAKRPGNATIVCTADNGKKKKQLKVIIKSDNGLIDQSMLETSGISSCNKLMIVAHPDDETLWGGGHLLDGGWYVVCLTNGYNNQRSKELANALAISKSKHIILNYPDLNQNRVKDDWKNVSEGIRKDISKVINYKSWDKIVSHNPEGEYGHIHHKKTNSIVNQVSKQTGTFQKLYYFGKFYSNDGKFYNKPILPPGLPVTYSGDVLLKKNSMIDAFTTQKNAIHKYWNQMIPYEEWIKATDW